MPTNASRNSMVLPLLGLLVEQPAHAYDLTARLAARYAHPAVTRSTVTSLLKTLAKEGLVAAGAPARVGNRPPRTVYELTGEGISDFRRRVASGLRDTAVASADFTMAVAYAGILPADRVVRLLTARLERVGELLASLDVAGDGVTEVHMLEVAYWRRIAGAEADWLGSLIARIGSDSIDWPGRTAPEGTPS
ncbi:MULTISPECIES: PadR family transcriptional regulator [unclassified Streptomyces]|uniref:PadR family transcriptional regulator n=1 Tax=unclassified Streptomyces TaxID=2593676 RepID=UPI0036571110